MGKAITFTQAFDPNSLDLPVASEMPYLKQMMAEDRATLYTLGDSWVVTEDLQSGQVGIPFCRGKIADMRQIFERLIDDCQLAGIGVCWVRGREGWHRAIKDLVDIEVHSVCYKITKKVVH